MISKDQVNSILEITGQSVDSIEGGVRVLKERLSDLDCDQYDDIFDLSLLITVVQILEGTTETFKDNPYLRTGSVLLTDEWMSIQRFADLKNFIEKTYKWKVLYRRHYFIFKINGRIFFRLEGLRRTVNGGHSCRLVLYRVPDIESLFIELDRYNLVQFKDREWKIVIDEKLNIREADGKYFLLSEIEDIVVEISKRL